MSDDNSRAEVIVQNLHFSYPPLTHDGNPVPVLRGINFQVPRGQFVALLGQTGAGKTTLCMALNGLVPQATGGVYRGDVTVAGLNTKQHAVAHLARFAGLVFQDPESQLVQMRVEDEVAFGVENLGLPALEIDARVNWALAAVGLSGYRDRSPLALSGGEKQRLAIAAILAMQPRVIVLDEPTASLDPAGKAGIFRLLAGLRARQDITILMATQELERIGRYADRVLVLHEGRIALDNRPAVVFGQVASLHEVGIGAPEMAELAYNLTQATGTRLSFTTEAAAYRELRHRGRLAARYRSCPAEVTLPPPAPDPGTERAQIMVERISYDYDGMPALCDVELLIRPGEFIALLGPNGAGKTTLARHLNGLLRPVKGRVMVENQDTRRVKVAGLASLVGYVFQNPDHQIFAATVREEIAFGLRNQGLSPAIIDQRVRTALDRFDLGNKADIQPALLGYGERRKVALAAILAMEPRILILDEPTTGLDWRSQQELLAVVQAFHDQGRTVVLITHDMSLVAGYTQRSIVLLGGGRVLFDGATRSLFQQTEVLSAAGLALPPVARLARRWRSLGISPGILTGVEFVTAWKSRTLQHKVIKRVCR